MDAKREEYVNNNVFALQREAQEKEEAEQVRQEQMRKEQEDEKEVSRGWSISNKAIFLWFFFHRAIHSLSSFIRVAERYYLNCFGIFPW